MKRFVPYSQDPKMRVAARKISPSPSPPKIPKTQQETPVNSISGTNLHIVQSSRGPKSEQQHCSTFSRQYRPSTARTENTRADTTAREHLHSSSSRMRAIPDSVYIPTLAHRTLSLPLQCVRGMHVSGEERRKASR